MPSLSELSHCFSAQIFHCFCPNFLLLLLEFPLLLPKFPIAFPQNSGKSNSKFGQKHWKNLGKSNEKTRKAVGYNYTCTCISGKLMEVLGNFTNRHIIFKFTSYIIRPIDQIKIMKDLAS